MDPLTAFSLAAGILQVLDFSFKAVAQCRELYKDGSLAENRATSEITETLGMWSPFGALLIPLDLHLFEPRLLYLANNNESLPEGCLRQ